MKIAGVAFLALVVSTSSADALVLCTMPDGRTYAGDTPPAGCVVKETYSSSALEADAPAPPQPAAETAAGDEFSVSTSNRRSKIERALNANAKNLGDVRREIASVSNSRVVAYSADFATAATVADAANLQSEKSEALTKLRSEERQTLAAMAALWKEFDALSDDVRERFGGRTPIWWRDRLGCSECPSRSEIENALK